MLPPLAQDVTTSPEWAALTAHHAAMAGRHLRDLFAGDPDAASG